MKNPPPILSPSLPPFLPPFLHLSYLHRLSFQLSRQNQLSQYYSRQIDEYIHKAEEAGNQQHILELQLVEIVKTTKELQKQVHTYT